MYRCVRWIVLVVLMWSGVAVGTAQADPWYEGEWKHEMGEVSLAVRFGVRGKGVLHMYKNGNNIGGGAITWKKAGRTLIASRNGVDMTFKLDERRKIVQTADGTPMTRIEGDKPAKKGGCDEACWANNASINDLKERYGSKTTPSRFSWAKSFAEGAGQRAFSACVKPHGFKGITDPIISARCTKTSQAACIKACTASGRSR
jgi:hypothetical protein